MNPESLFSASNLLAMAGWLLLIFAPRARWSVSAVSAIPLILAGGYMALILLHWGGSPGGFSSFAAVSQLFSNRWLLLAGWIHYLAFDLFIGAWQVRDSAQSNVPHYLVVPCLLLTFLFGPIGLLSYLSIRRLRVVRSRAM